MHTRKAGLTPAQWQQLAGEAQSNPLGWLAQFTRMSQGQWDPVGNWVVTVADARNGSVPRTLIALAEDDKPAEDEAGLPARTRHTSRRPKSKRMSSSFL
jgi:hypothetical protein